MAERVRRLLILAVTLMMLASCGGASDEAQFVGTGEVAEGDCINLPSDTGAVTAFQARDCAEGHDGQVLGVFDLQGDGVFPGVDEVLVDAEAGCIEQFETFIGVPYGESIYFLQSFTPTADSWVDNDDRTLLCVVLPGEGSGQLTRDLRGAAE